MSAVESQQKSLSFKFSEYCIDILPEVQLMTIVHKMLLIL